MVKKKLADEPFKRILAQGKNNGAISHPGRKGEKC